jgi:hypothetical protein
VAVAVKEEKPASAAAQAVAALIAAGKVLGSGFRVQALGEV